MVFVRSLGAIGHRPVFDCTPPILAGFEPQPGFVF
jgi:hypothetical protein